MRYSYSGVSCFEKCKFKYKMLHIDGIKTDSPTDPNNALILGTAVHTGIEKDLETAIQEYIFSYPIITDEHINEIIKLKNVIPKARVAIPEGGKFEVEIKDSDFHGFIDYLVNVDDSTIRNEICDKCNLRFGCFNSYTGYCHKGKFANISSRVFDIYDFKYTGNPTNYKNSAQLHLYKYFFEKNNPGARVENLYYVFIPKTQIRQMKTETLFEFRKRLESELSNLEVKIVQQEFDYNKVIEFLLNIKKIKEETKFPKYISKLCGFCEFQEFCEKGNDYFMKLPENKRKTNEKITKRTMWIYGAPFSGKTTFANAFPDPLMLNTDGNIKFLEAAAPSIRIKDEVTVVGRQTKRTLAWEMFKDAISELEKQENTFKTIVVDLLEDLYEYCRVYMYGQMGITHESDDRFRAWDKVRSEFLNTLKRLMNLDYENIILISHEDMTKDITKKGGDKITAIKPNLQDKVALKVSGMVDIVARVIADGDIRTLSFKSNEVIFGGGRLKVATKSIPLDVVDLFAVYDEANSQTNKSTPATEQPTETANTTKSRRKKTADPKPTEPETPPVDDGLERATEDLYAVHTESGSPIVIKKGEIIPQGGGLEYITKDAYETWYNTDSESQTAETTEETASEDEPPFEPDTTQTTETAAPTEAPAEEKPRRKRRARE